MDKIILDKEQLTTLTHFIWKRGFREPDIVQEILDHFACKVEEVMADEPKLNLQEAMYKAHESFGVMGFAPIVSAYRAGIIAKQKLIVKMAWRKAFTSIPTILIAILTGISTYKFFFWAEANGVRFLHASIVQDLLLLAFLLEMVMTVILTGGLKKYRSKGYFKFDKIQPYIFSMVIFMPENAAPVFPKLFVGIFWSCIATYFVLVTLVNIFIMQIVDKENAMYEIHAEQ